MYTAFNGNVLQNVTKQNEHMRSLNETNIPSFVTN